MDNIGRAADSQDASSSEDSARPSALSNSALERLQLHLQLQKLNSPLSFYSNPELWPPMHPPQEKMFNDFQLPSEDLGNYPDHRLQIDTANINPHPGNASSFYEPTITADSITSIQYEPIKTSNYSLKNSPRPQEMSLNVEQMLCGNNDMQPAAISSLIHSDHQTDGKYYCRTSDSNNFISQENQHHQMMLDFDSFKGILEEPNTWDDSSSVDVHGGGGGGIMFQDYETGYNHL